MVTVEVLTFQKPTYPNGYLTTHVRMEIDGKVVRIYEASGWGASNCPRLALEAVVTSVKIDAAKIFRRTEFGYKKTIRKHPVEIAKKLDKAAEAVFKPEAREVKMCEKIEKEGYIGAQNFIGMIGAKLIWK